MNTKGAGRRLSAVLATAAVAALVVAGCGGDDNKDSGGSSGGSSSSSSSSSGGGAKKGGGTVKVGNISSIAGLGGTFSGYEAGVKAYFDYANANGGINGSKIEFTQIDDAADPSKAASAARKLVTQDKVLAIVGMASFADAAVAKYLNTEKVPVVGGWATSSSWHKPNTNMFVSLEGPNPPYCTLWSSPLAAAHGVKKEAFIAQDFPTATLDADCRATAAKKVGIEVVGKRIDVALDAADYRPAVQRAMAAGADAIEMSTGTDGHIKTVQAGEQLGFKGVYVPTQPAGLEKGLAKFADKLDGRVLTSAFGLLPSDPEGKNEELDKFKKGMAQFAPKYKDEITAVSGWAASKLFADALTAAGPDRDAIMKWISGQKAYDFGGLQGPIDYTIGSTATPCTTSLVMKGGKFVRDTSGGSEDFRCDPLIDFKTGETNAYSQYDK